MKKTVLLIACLSALTAQAQTIYKSEKNGVTTYSNSPIAGGTKITLPPLSIIPSIAVERTAPVKASAPAEQTAGQKNRENARRDVLAEELKREQLALAAAEAELANQESVRNGDEKNYQKVLDRVAPFKEAVELHRKNIASLIKEQNSQR